MSEQNTSPDNIRGRGQPTKYKEEYVELAFNYCLLGADDARLSQLFDIDEKTLNNWKHAHPDFFQSIKAGREEADGRVSRSLYERAMGYSHKAVKIFCDPKSGAREIVEYTEHYPPDPTSMIFWLKNRQKKNWRDKLDHEHQIINDELTDDQIRDRIALLQKVVLQKAETAQRNKKSSESV